MKNYLALLLLSFIFSSCVKKSDSKKVLQIFQEFDKGSKDFVILYDSINIVSDTTKSSAIVTLLPSKNLSTIDSKLLNKKYGHDFFFQHTGRLLKYFYFVQDAHHFSYGIEYDILDGYYTETGTPYVDYMEYNSDSGDDRKIFFLFSTFPRQNIIVSTSKDSIDFKPVKLKKSAYLPFIEIYEYKATRNDSVIYFNIKASNPIVNLKNLPSTLTTVKKVQF